MENLLINKCNIIIRRNLESNFIFKKNYGELALDEKAYFVSRRYREAVVLFVKRMKDVKSRFYFKNLEKNIEILRIKNKLFLVNSIGNYNCIDNVISMVLKHCFSSIYHELMHMASFYLTDDGIYMIGFRQFRPFLLDIGGGLNEGYTELLTERYFFDQGVDYTYKCLVNFAKDIESIVGKDKMEELYFNSDLYNLKEDIIKDCSEEEFMQFLNDSDWFLVKGKNYDFSELIERAQRMGNFVYLTYLKRQNRLFLDDEISVDEYENRLAETITKIDKLYFDFDGKVFWKCNKKKMSEELLKIGIEVSGFEDEILEDDKTMVKKN